MKKINQRINQNPLKKFNIDYFLTYPLIFIILGIFLLPKLAFLSSITEQNIINLTNKERVNLGIPILTINPLLTKAAYAKGKSIIESQTFQHNIGDRKFSAWIKDVDYKYIYVGENLALDFTTSEGAMRAWLDSSSHKKNILNEKFKETGVAIIDDNFQGKNTTIIVQIFGTQEEFPVNTITTTPKIEKEAIQNQNNNLGLSPVKYQPNILKSPLDALYNKKMSMIIVLNFITILFISIFFAMHKLIYSDKKQVKCTK